MASCLRLVFLVSALHLASGVIHLASILAQRKRQSALKNNDTASDYGEGDKLVLSPTKDGKSSWNPASGAWQAEDFGGHVYSTCLSKAMGSLATSRGVQTALDLGAGTGHYSAAMIALGIKASCYDGNKQTPGLSAHLCSQMDLAVDIVHGNNPQTNATTLQPADFVWSFEVGEHIPIEKEAVFMDNLAGLASKILVLSWAAPGQHGQGHVNERDNFYIIQEMQKRGLTFDAEASLKLRNEAVGENCCCIWFKNTLMVFNRTA